MRKKVIAGNWKMNKTLDESKQFINEVVDQLPKDLDHIETIVCGPFVYLQALVEGAKDSDVKIGAQTMHYEASGAYTGEVSPTMLQDIGTSHVIIGHSERRQYFGETDETVNQKVHAAFEHSLKPIVCVGETLEQKESGATEEHVKNQVMNAIKDLTEEQVSQLIIAYEPIWAIGTGKTASSTDANDVCTHIRQTIAEATTDTVADAVIVQYGGSVNPDNISELLNQDNIDGALVGGASLESQSFLKLVEAVRHG